MKKKSKRIITISLVIMLVFGIANTAMAVSYNKTLNPRAYSDSLQNTYYTGGFRDKNTSALSTISGVNVPSYYYVRLVPGGEGGAYYASKRNYNGSTVSWGSIVGNQELEFTKDSQYTVATYVKGTFEFG